MYIEISEADRKHRINLPRFLVLNSLTTSAAAIFSKADISARQARAALRAVKAAAREYELTSICDIQIISDEADGTETTVSIHI